MNTQAGRWSAVTHRGSWSRHRRRHAVCILLSGLAGGMLSDATHADTFANVYYSARKDQLVVTMVYRGTNPDHTFSLKWGQCKDIAEGGGHEIAAEVLDSQWQDVEQSDFKKTTRFSLAGLRCRPSKVTLRSAPRFFYTLQIPERAIQKP
jgi:hypothetical protein